MLSAFAFEVIAIVIWAVLQTKKENRTIARMLIQLRSSSDPPEN